MDASAEDEGRRSLSEYELVRHLGSGAFADVALYRHPPTGRLVAIKSVKRTAHASGINLGAFKELAAFAEIAAHPNVLTLHRTFTFAGQAHLVLEYCATDLAAIARDKSVTLGEADVKGFMLQLLDGLSAVHAARMLHADLKPENVLVDGGGTVKLGDFGHTAPWPEPGRPRSNRIVTVWYRAPELLAGARTYTAAVDMWAVGCVLGELLLRCPLFPAAGGPDTTPGEWERAQMAAIQRLLGTPVDTLAGEAGGAGGEQLPPFSFNDAAWSASSVLQAHVAASASAGQMRAPVFALPAARQAWPGCSSLPSFGEYEPRKPQPWRSVVPPGTASDAAIDLLSRLLLYDPSRRLTAAEALNHPWFAAAPPPTPPGRLPLGAAGARAAKA